MLEKRFKTVPPQSLLADGTTLGEIKVPNSKLFKVKQKIHMVSSGTEMQTLEIKRITDINTMFLGPLGSTIDSRIDVSMYTVADGAFLYAEEQQRVKIPEQELFRHTYAEEPTVAQRVLLVDPLGERIDEDNPLPIDGTISVTFDGPSNPFVTNISAPTIGEYSFLFPKETKRVLIRLRNSTKFKIAFVAGDTSLNFITILPGCFYSEDGLDLKIPLRLYFATTKINETAEILYWT